MALTQMTPEQLALLSDNGLGSFFYTAPDIFLYGTTRFAIVMDASGTRRLRAYKRNNVGPSWAEVDAGNGPTVSSSAKPAAPTYIVDPMNADEIICAYAAATSRELKLSRFNMNTETWGSPTAALGPILDDTATTGNNGDDTGCKSCITYRASTDSDLVVFQGTKELIGGTNYLRAYLSEYDRASLTWSITPTLLFGGSTTNHYMAQGVVTADNDDVHIFFTEMGTQTAGNPSSNMLYHAVCTSGINVSFAGIAANDLKIIYEPTVGYPRIRTAGTAQELLVPYITADSTETNRRAGVVRAIAQGTAVTTWTKEEMSTDGTNSPIGFTFVVPSIAMGTDGKPYGFWIGNQTNPDLDVKVFYSLGGEIGDPWSTPASLLTLPGTDGDIMEFQNACAIGTIGFAMVAMEFQSASYFSGTAINAYLETYYGTAAAGFTWIYEA